PPARGPRAPLAVAGGLDRGRLRPHRPGGLAGRAGRLVNGGRQNRVSRSPPRRTWAVRWRTPSGPATSERLAPLSTIVASPTPRSVAQAGKHPPRHVEPRLHAREPDAGAHGDPVVDGPERKRRPELAARIEDRVCNDAPNAAHATPDLDPAVRSRR